MKDATPAALVVVGLAAAAILATTTIHFPREQESRRQMECMNHLSSLAQRYLAVSMEGRVRPKLHGAAQIRSWFFRGEDQTDLLCPGDVVAPDAAPGSCSYAVRDFERFPIDPASKEKQIILCDRQGADGRTMHHRNVVIVAYASGETAKLSREELGIDDDPIYVGPEAQNAKLAKLERP